mgnify:CR=1 FL=1
MVNKVELELGDLQGGILSAYGKIGFPRARYMLFHIDDGAAGRAFVEKLRPLVTTARRWPSSKNISTGKDPQAKPDCTLNLAFTYALSPVSGWNQLPIWLRVLATTVVLTPIMTYWVLPWVTRTLRHWLNR